MKAWLRGLALTLSFLALGGVSACAGRGAEDQEGQQQMPPKPIETVLKEHTDHLMSLPGVVGTAIGECEGKPCIKVLVVRKSAELARKIPPTLDGFPVAIQETGEIRALDSG